MRSQPVRLFLLPVLLAAAPAAAAQTTPQIVSSPQPAITRAMTLAYQGDYEGAIRAFEEARKAGACEGYNCHGGLAEVYRQVGRMEDAVREARASVAFQEAAGQSPVFAYNELGVSLAQAAGADTARLQEAEGALRRAVAAYRGDVDDFRYNLAVVLRRLGKAEEAQALFDELRRGPGSRPVFSNRPAVIGRFEAAKVIHNPPPIYPGKARRKGTEGEVTLQGTIDTRGRLQDVEILRGAPDGLDKSVRKALEDWRFAPATLDGEPVASRYFVSFRMLVDKR
jgi:TonB family protein